MTLPGSYTQKPGAIPAYFDAILDAQAPERFSIKFLENLGFTSTNDRLLIGILKDLGFLTADRLPQERYYAFMDRSRSRFVVAEAIREAYSDLFAVNTRANELGADEIKNKLRTLYAGRKTDNVIDRIAKTFSALCDYADFTEPPSGAKGRDDEESKKKKGAPEKKDPRIETGPGTVSLDSLQYHINIVLPESRDQAVYDAIFRSLREHLGTRHE